MNLGPLKHPAPLQGGVRRRPVAARGAAEDSSGVAPSPRDPEDDLRPEAEPPEPGWRASSYDLKHGLDVVELPTTLPVEVLDRLFNAPGK